MTGREAVAFREESCHALYIRVHDGKAVHPLVDLLPASIVTVALAKPQLCPKESTLLFEGLPALKVERVPKLEKVIVESDEHVSGRKIVFKADDSKVTLE